MATDLRQMRVAVSLPETIRTRADGVRMDAVVKIAGEPDESAVFHLVEAETGLALPEPEWVGRIVRFFRLGEADAVRLDALRRTIEAKRAEGRRGSLGFGIAAREFCRLGVLPQGAVPLTTYLKTSETGRFVIVTDAFDLRSDPRIGASLDGLPPC
jgi:hypothetical protein